MSKARTLRGAAYEEFMRARMKYGGLAGLVGYEGRGPSKLATRSIGLSFGTFQRLGLIDKTVGDRREKIGYGLTWADRLIGRISPARIVRFALIARIFQVGPDNAGLTMDAPKIGAYTGIFERSIAITFWPSGDEAWDLFKKRMIQLAEEPAYAFAQKDINIMFAEPDGKTDTGAASPTGFPPPSDPEFDRFAARIARQGTLFGVIDRLRSAP